MSTHPPHIVPLHNPTSPSTQNAQDTPVKQGINAEPVHNRIFAVMIHTTRYAFKSKARLAFDCGVAPSTICRLILGQSSPSFSLVTVITDALEKQLQRSIDPRELVSRDGLYPTASVCDLCGCKGCLPDEVYDEDDAVRPEYKDVQAGQWTTLSPQHVEKVLQEEEGL